MVALRIAEGTVPYEVAPPDTAWLGEPPPEPVNESELSWIWAGQRYPAGALGLVDGRSLRVVNPGRPGGGAGPDFLDAVLEIDGVRVRGDVELHVRSSGFRAHGHDADPAYDGVALHVVFRADEGSSTRLSSGVEAPVAAFAPWFDSRRDELQRWLGAEPLWREPCREAVTRLGREGVRSRLREAGLRRFEAKAGALRALAVQEGEPEAVWRTLFDIMGVGGDRDGFRRLAAAFPERLAQRVMAAGEGDEAGSLASALCRVAGLAGYYESTGGLPARLRPSLVSSGRPANRPERRLAGIATLCVRAGSDLPAFVMGTVSEADTARDLVAAWQVTARGAALIGPDRARELALNLALPFAAGEPGLRSQAEALLDGLGAAPAYGKTVFLERNLSGEPGRLVRGALAQQGLLAFLGEWCSRGGCGRCPLSSAGLRPRSPRRPSPVRRHRQGTPATEALPTSPRRLRPTPLSLRGEGTPATGWATSPPVAAATTPSAPPQKGGDC